MMTALLHRRLHEGLIEARSTVNAVLQRVLTGAPLPWDAKVPHAHCCTRCRPVARSPKPLLSPHTLPTA